MTTSYFKASHAGRTYFRGSQTKDYASICERDGVVGFSSKPAGNGFSPAERIGKPEYDRLVELKKQRTDGDAPRDSWVEDAAIEAAGYAAANGIAPELAQGELEAMSETQAGETLAELTAKAAAADEPQIVAPLAATPTPTPEILEPIDGTATGDLVEPEESLSDRVMQHAAEERAVAAAPAPSILDHVLASLDAPVEPAPVAAKPRKAKPAAAKAAKQAKTEPAAKAPRTRKAPATGDAAPAERGPTVRDQIWALMRRDGGTSEREVCEALGGWKKAGATISRAIKAAPFAVRKTRGEDGKTRYIAAAEA